MCIKCSVYTSGVSRPSREGGGRKGALEDFLDSFHTSPTFGNFPRGGGWRPTFFVDTDYVIISISLIQTRFRREAVTPFS